MPRARRAARGTRRSGGPPPAPPAPPLPGRRSRGDSGAAEGGPQQRMPLLGDPRLARVPRPHRTVITALQRRDVEMDRHQVIEENRPGGERAHRRDRFHVALARSADLDPPHLLAFLGGEVAQTLMVGPAAADTAQRRARPPRAAPPAAPRALAPAPPL